MRTTPWLAFPRPQPAHQRQTSAALTTSSGPVRGGVVTNDGLACATMAKLGLGLAYAPEPNIRDDLDAGRLQVVLEPYAPTVPGYFIYYPSRAQRSTPLRLFVETAKEVLLDRRGA